MPVCVTKRASGGGGVPYVPPASRVDHKGSWDPTTNTPTLADGAGDVGDEYKISASGTRDLGNGDIEADWDDYMAQLDNRGLNDVLEVMQTAYDRQYGG